jgi:hypothetical protein
LGATEAWARVMRTDIHGVDPTQFKANLKEHSFRDGSRKRPRKNLVDVRDGTNEGDTGEDRLEPHCDSSVEHLDIQA